MALIKHALTMQGLAVDPHLANIGGNLFDVNGVKLVSDGPKDH